MDNTGFIGNLRNANGDVFVKANGYASGNAPANKPYGLSNTNNTTSAPQPQTVQKTSVKVTPTKSKVTKIYDDGGVDIQTTIKEAEPYNLMNGNYGRAEYSYQHIPGKALKRSVIGAYNGKYTPSEAKAIIDKDILKNIYNNVGATLEYDDAQKAAITTLIDASLDAKYGSPQSERAKLGPSGSKFNPTMERIKQSVQNGKEGETITLTAGDTSEGPAGASQEGPGTIGYDTQEGVYEYTYAPGDNFGNVLIKMGLSDGRNLWGPNGDVAYYTQQLNNQGIYGNIPIGTKIRLRKRA